MRRFCPKRRSLNITHSNIYIGMPSRRTGVDRKGQFIVVGAIVIVAFMFALILTISQMNAQRQAFSYEPVGEVVLAVSSDFERCLQSAFSKASQIYLSDRNSTKAQGTLYGELREWLKAVSNAYSGYGMNVAFTVGENRSCVDLRFDWSEGHGTSYVYTTFGLDVMGYGLEGLALMKSIAINLDILEAKVSLAGDHSVVVMKFRVSERVNEGKPTTPSIKEVNVTAVGGGVDENSIKLEYLGQGVYLVEFNLTGFVAEEVTLAVKTSNGVVVAAKKGLCVVELRSDDVSTPPEDNGGTFTVNGTAFSQLPRNISVFPGQVLNVSFETDEGLFLGFSISGPLKIIEQQGSRATIRVSDRGLGEIAALYTSSSYVPSGMCYINVGSQEIHGESFNKGVVEIIEVNGILNGIKYNLSETGPIVLALPYNSNVSIRYYPEYGYVFRYWFLSGDLVINDTFSQTITVGVLGNGTLTAIYEASRPEDWRIIYISPEKTTQGRDKDFNFTLTLSPKEGQISPPLNPDKPSRFGNSDSKTPELLLGDNVTIILYAKADPRDMQLKVTLGYYDNEGFKLIGSGERWVSHSWDIIYLSFSPTNKVIPKGSTLVLILERIDKGSEKGTLHISCGSDESRIVLW